MWTTPLIEEKLEEKMQNWGGKIGREILSWGKVGRKILNWGKVERENAKLRRKWNVTGTRGKEICELLTCLYSEENLVKFIRGISEDNITGYLEDT